MNHSHKIAFKVTCIYIVFGFLWIALTDSLSMSRSHENMQRFAMLQYYKGWIYIFLSGLFLYSIIRYWTNKALRTQQELRVKDEQYQSLFKHSPDSVVELNPKGTILSVNKNAEKLFGLPGDELYGKSAYRLLTWNEPEKLHQYYEKSVKGEAVKFETSIDREGESLILRITFLPIIVHGKQLGVYALARDITELRREEELMIMSEKLSVIGDLAAAVAHEIRNPLTSLKGFVQLMAMEKEVNPMHTDIMLREIEHITIISGELLALGKKQDVAVREINLGDCVRDIFTFMKAETNLNNIDMSLDVRSETPIIILGNPTEVKQVFINLLKNSIEAIETEGRISILIEANDGEAVVQVIDNGVGIEPRRLERIGEPFYSTKEKGTGIGLAVCWGIIHRLEGEMQFDSVKNEGTVVTVRIPLAVSPA